MLDKLKFHPVINRYTEDVNVYIHGNDGDASGCDVDVSAGRGNPDECHCLWGGEDYTFCAYKIVNETAAEVNYDSSMMGEIWSHNCDSNEGGERLTELGSYTGGELTGGAFTGQGDTASDLDRSVDVQLKPGDVFAGGDTEESRRVVHPLNIFRKRRHHKKATTRGAICPKREGEQLMCRDAKTIGSCYHMSYTCHILVLEYQFFTEAAPNTIPTPLRILMENCTSCLKTLRIAEISVPHMKLLLDKLDALTSFRCLVLTNKDVVDAFDLIAADFSNKLMSCEVQQRETLAATHGTQLSTTDAMHIKFSMNRYGHRQRVLEKIPKIIATDSFY
eukprot:gene28384-35230_t